MTAVRQNCINFSCAGLGVAVLVFVVSLVLQNYAPALLADSAVSSLPHFQIKNPIDRYVLEKLQAEKIEPSGLCTDDEFLRRVYLDLNGSVPPLADAKAFLLDHASDKRAKLIDRLLKSERYGAHWSVLWSDLLREHSNSRPQEGTQRGSYREWIQDALNNNMPYDLFMKSLVDAIGNAEEDPAVNFYLRDENSRVETVNNISTVFMGTRMACAQCHDHPFDKWTQTDFHGLMAFFGRTNVQIDPWATLLKAEKSKVVPDDARKIMEPYFKEAHEKVALEKANYKKGVEAAADGGGTGNGMGMMDMLGVLGRGGKLIKELEAKLSPADMQRMRLLLLNGGVRKVFERPFGEYRMPADGDGADKRAKNSGEVVAPAFAWDKSLNADGKGSRRTVLANYVAGNRQFAAVQANRVWASLMGRGIVDPLDDFRAKNPPSNPELLDFLTDEFIRLKFDNKALIALICNSSTYQRSSQPTASNRGDTTLFSHARVRRMSAEQTFDSILVSTGKNNGLSVIAAFGMGMGKEMMSEKIVGGLMGYEQKKNTQNQWAVDLPTPSRPGMFMNTFNQPDRDSTVCKRDESGSIPQALEMLNGATINGAIKSSPLIGSIMSAKMAPREAAQELFLSVLSRLPSSGEMASVCNRANGTVTREWIEDVYWALLNTREFTFIK